MTESEAHDHDPQNPDPIHLINAAGEDIDAGVPVAAELVTVLDDGTRDYSAFYDFERIREQFR